MRLQRRLPAAARTRTAARGVRQAGARPPCRGMGEAMRCAVPKGRACLQAGRALGVMIQAVPEPPRPHHDRGVPVP